MNRRRLADRPAPISAPIQQEGSNQHVRKFVCEFPDCNLEFTTKTGRGVHCNRMHKAWWDAKQLAENPSSRGQWTVEEKSLLARKEAEVWLEGRDKGKSDNQIAKSVNAALYKIFEGRTQEAVKGIRRRPSHKERVQSFITELHSNEETHDDDENHIEPQANEPIEIEVNESTDYKDELYKCIKEPIETEGFYKERLYEICNNLGEVDISTTIETLALYIKSILPSKEPSSTTHERMEVPKNRKQKRRADFKKVQDLWKKNRSRCWKTVEADLLDADKVCLPKETMIPFWKAVMTRDTKLSPNIEQAENEIGAMIRPVSQFEVTRSYPPKNTAPGVDGINVRELKKIPPEILTKIFNIFLYCGKVPEYMLKSKTILIPKKKDAKEPGDFRPITISSVIIRMFHKIIANRLKSISIDERQRAFIRTDGCNDNIFLLDLILRYHRANIKGMFLASTDIAKAYDSVSFEALMTVMMAKGLPQHLVKYIMYVYRSSVTRFEHGDWTSEFFHPTCGVKQGDPMSSVLFNFIIDYLLIKIPDDIGVHVSNMHVNVMAFADDMILMASSKSGLQELLNISSEYLYLCGLDVNANKCCSIAIKNIPQKKKVSIDKSCTFQINGRTIPALTREDEWKYLGVPFTPEGRISTNVRNLLKEKVEKLSKAPFKPQQRLFILNVSIIPSIMYQLITGNIKIGLLRTLDRDIRATVRSWLRLPKDCTNAYFHAAVKDGGLGIQSLRWTAPSQRKAKLESIQRSTYIHGIAVDQYLTKEYNTVIKRLTENNILLDTKSKIDQRWAEKLYISPDGVALKESSKVLGQNDWIQDGTMFLSGRDYINSCQFRINAMPTRSRTTRGRFQDRSCRGGCSVPETLNHITQHCHRTHGVRIKRHNAVVFYLVKRLEKQGYEVEVEPRYATDQGNRFPDIVATKNEEGLIIDAQVMSEQADLRRADREKVRKYLNNASLIEAIKTHRNVNTVKVVAATLNSRGIWCQESANILQGLHIILRKDVKTISSRVIIGGLACFHQFTCTTQVTRNRR